MSYSEDEEAYEHTLLVVREVSVFKIPPRATSGGYKCGEWLQSDKIWSGRLRVVSCNTRCEIRLEERIPGALRRLLREPGAEGGCRGIGVGLVEVLRAEDRGRAWEVRVYRVGV
ncbi:UNVERIFIED_CONTAM: hypothetical protein Sradi_0443700 [Sesamum radiatum]|uniref:NECAP PHear domain-containing protein n=1 Tax=Sesamum radiatum TaxID=300843 RepID=A0AAW2W7H4_SESRA